MEVLFTFTPRVAHQQKLKEEFPEANFYFTDNKSIHIDTVDVWVTFGEDVTEEDINAATNLKWIMVASAGVEKMPNQAIKERGIIMSNVRGIHKTPMSESVLAHLLALKRSLPFIYESQRSNEWNRKTGSSELLGSTALIIGPGAIGSEIGRLLQAFGVRTIGCNRSGDAADYMDDMVTIADILNALPQADIIISVVPSTKETKHMLKKEHFDAMKQDAIFMNFGRGDLVEDQVLVEVLQNGQIAFAVLDVFEQEPLPLDHPFWNMQNVIISPHASSHSEKYVERALEIFTPNLRKWLDQDTNPTNLVDLDRGY